MFRVHWNSDQRSMQEPRCLERPRHERFNPVCQRSARAACTGADPLSPGVFPLFAARGAAMNTLIQQPHPPSWLPGTASMETIDFAARHKYPYMTVFMPMEQRKAAYEMYRRVAEEKYGYEAPPEQLAFCTPCIVAETDEQAIKEGEKYGMWLFNKGLKVRPQFNFPPGYVSERSFMGILKSGVWQRTERPTFKELMDTGVVIAGSVDTVIEKLSYY